MYYPNSTEKIELLDAVLVDHRLSGVVVGFDRINGREFIEIRGELSRFWASLNQVQKLKTLQVSH